ncbi:hypothetical protein [Streptomyces sp. NPDC005548]|uniref:hypothetical protein n=1 Tax=Streptomyces sp. NPDC005548 TaxID=3364724 RepID=UPI0036CBF5EB
MADNDDTGTLIQFPRIGFNLDPSTTVPGPIPPLPDTAPFTPSPDPAIPAPRSRRSPLDTLAAMPEPGLALPVIAAPQPGHIPDTFRAEPDRDHVGPRLGALSLAAILAVAIAAMRGIHGAVTAWGANRAERQAAADTKTPGPKDKDGKGGGKKRVPSGADYGRKTLNRSTGSGGGGRSGGGSGKGGGSKGSGGGAARRTGPKSKTGSGSGSAGGGGLSSGRKTPTRKTPGVKDASKDASRKTKRTPGGRDQAVKNRKSPKSPTSGTGNGGSKSGAGLLKQQQQQKKRKDSAGGAGRTGLTDAASKQAQKQADRRLKRRRKNLTSPALWGNDAKKKSTTDPKAKKRSPGRTSFTQAAKKHAVKAAERRWKRRQKKTTVPPTAPKANTHRTREKTPRNHRRMGTSYWSRFRNRRHKAKPSRPTGPTPGPNPGPSAGAGGPTPGGRQGRKTPWQSAAGVHTDTVITVERLDNVGDQARRHPEDTPTPFALPASGPAALDAAPTPHTARPGTTRPRPMPPAPTGGDPRIKEHRRMAANSPIVHAAGRQMDAQHATEITLDDALDEYGAFKDDAFKTHDQSAKLAERARRLRDVLADFAEDLAVNHNLIGPLFSAAMFRMSESMDLVARMSEEMKTSSLEAAELAESADNDLNDTYRPYTQATADAGLTTPSAPIHNNV